MENLALLNAQVRSPTSHCIYFLLNMKTLRGIHSPAFQKKCVIVFLAKTHNRGESVNTDLHRFSILTGKADPYSQLYHVCGTVKA